MEESDGESYKDLFSPPALAKKAGQTPHSSGPGDQSSKDSANDNADLAQELDRFYDGELSLNRARRWIERFEKEGDELPERYQATAPHRYIEKSPPPSKEDLKPSKAPRQTGQPVGCAKNWRA